MEDNTDKSARDKQFNTDLNGKTITRENRTTQNDRKEFHESFETQQYPNYWNGTDCQYKNAREYAQVLQTWLWQYRFFSAMNTFHCHLVSSMPQQHQPQGLGFQPSVTSEQNVGNLQNVPLVPIRERLIQPHGRAANTTGILLPIFLTENCTYQYFPHSTRNDIYGKPFLLCIRNIDCFHIQKISYTLYKISYTLYKRSHILYKISYIRYLIMVIRYLS